MIIIFLLNFLPKRNILKTYFTTHMPVVTFDYNDFIKILKEKIPIKKLVDELPMIGGDLDKVENDEISIEFFPNRPDLLSVEGIVRAVRSFYNFKPGLKKYNVKKSDLKLIVDPSIKKVRPYIATALVKNVEMTDELIKSLMELQEKLHLGLGRNRKKVAIGVHNYEPIKGPFVYKAVDPDKIQFVPLNGIESLTLNQILKKHEKGIDYAFILKGFDKHPIIFDKDNNVLSYPPIINGILTEVTPFTKDLFIDVTGTDKKAVNYALNIVVTTLAERGGDIYSTTVIDNKKSFITPDLKPKLKKISIEHTNSILGTDMNFSQIKKCLEKMGYNAKKINSDKIEVEIPAWRADIIHEIDIIEDIAIGYGYDKFSSDMPKKLTFGKSLKQTNFNENLRKIMIGLGFTEVTTFTISNKVDEFKKIGKSEEKIAEIINPIGEEYSCLRLNLLSSLLNILNENRHHSLPQQIFEIGDIIDKKYENRNHLGFVKISAKANYTECKSYINAVLRDVGINFNIQNFNHPGFINGRCAKVLYKAKEIGFFGELHPKTITNFELEHPIIACELDLGFF